MMLRKLLWVNVGTGLFVGSALFFFPDISSRLYLASRLDICDANCIDLWESIVPVLGLFILTLNGLIAVIAKQGDNKMVIWAALVVLSFEIVGLFVEGALHITDFNHMMTEIPILYCITTSIRVSLIVAYSLALLYSARKNKRS